MARPVGWRNESARHAAAAKGIPTKALQTGKARRKFGLDTDAESYYSELRNMGWHDLEAQAEVFRREGYKIEYLTDSEEEVLMSLYNHEMRKGRGSSFVPVTDSDYSMVQRLKKRGILRTHSRPYYRGRNPNSMIAAQLTPYGRTVAALL